MLCRLAVLPCSSASLAQNSLVEETGISRMGRMLFQNLLSSSNFITVVFAVTCLFFKWPACFIVPYIDLLATKTTE